jgi:hypothetical protein
MKYTKLTIKINSTNKPPYFVGSQLRGAFGYALKKVTCINPTFKCEGCFATTNCLYYDFYEKKMFFINLDSILNWVMTFIIFHFICLMILLLNFHISSVLFI